jgi:hypothetical protein
MHSNATVKPSMTPTTSGPSTLSPSIPLSIPSLLRVPRDRVNLGPQGQEEVETVPQAPGLVAAVAFNYDGTKIAVGVSYTWDDGEKGFKTNAVAPWLGVRMVGEEVKVRFVYLFFFFCPARFGFVFCEWRIGNPVICYVPICIDHIS